MALEDPFSAVRGEVQKAVNTARGLYERWCELLQETHVVSTEEFDWTTNELRNSLRSIEWDLEDLEETIGIVEANPRKPISQKPPPERYGQLREELVSANSRYIEEQQLHQQLIIDQQDEQLELVSGSIRVLKHMSGRVGDELDEQSLMLEEFAQEMDGTQSHMDGVLKKMAKVSHMTSDRRQWCVIGILLVLLIVVLILFFTL
ncbi:syntaxin-10 isoform X2 [Emys orbicularis]|uniref:syntaxin-10 isoform X2 n=1 Tax=Emys orbicularis TaxID=82168 RepID=UPI0031FD12EE